MLAEQLKISGLPPYAYRWSTVPVQTTQTAVNLASGIAYRVTVTDGCGNTAMASRTPTNSYTLATTLTSACSPTGQCIGTATSTPTNGVSPYSYYWNNGKTTQTAVNLCVVRYYVTTTDANGCTRAGNIRIWNCAAKSISDPIDIIKPIDKPDFSLTPNPASGKVTLSGNDLITTGDLRIYNSIGQIIYSNENVDFTDSEILVDISPWRKGIYLVVVYTELISKRLVVE